MPFTQEEIAAVLAELREPLIGARVDKVRQDDAHAVWLTLRSSSPGPLASSNAACSGLVPGVRRAHILLSAHPSLARVHAVPELPASRPPRDAFGALLRESLLRARVCDLRQPGRARAVEIDFERAGPPGTRPSRWTLVAEIAGRPPNLVLLDSGRRLVGAQRPVRVLASGSDRGGGTRQQLELAVGEVYRPALAPAPPSSLAAQTSSPWRYLKGGDGPFALSFAFAASYGADEERLQLEETRSALVKSLGAAATRRKSLLVKLDEDLRRSRELEGSLRLGELLKAAMPKLRRGLSSVEVIDYFAPGMPLVTIALDPALPPRANVDRYFQRYRKGERAIPLVEGRRATTARELESIEALAGRTRLALDASALAGVASDAAGLIAQRTARTPAERQTAASPRGGAPRAKEARRFTSIDGWAILVGRDARGNETLTLRTARGNDTFLHVSGRAGAHVIVRSQLGKQTPLETLLDAAQLALEYSLPKGKGAERARGGAFDVDYTEVKHVRKPRGARPGLVLLSRHRTLRIAFDAARSARLHDSRDQEPGAGAPPTSR